MELHARLVHAETGRRVVEVRASRGEHSLGSALAEAPTAQEAEDLATARLLQRLAAGDVTTAPAGGEDRLRAGPARHGTLPRLRGLESPPTTVASGAIATAAGAADAGAVDTRPAAGRPVVQGPEEDGPKAQGMPSATASPPVNGQSDATPHRAETDNISRTLTQSGLPLHAPLTRHAPLSAANGPATATGGAVSGGGSEAPGPSAAAPPPEAYAPNNTDGSAGPGPAEAGTSEAQSDPQEEPPADPEDWSQELTAVDLQLRRLGWDREQEGLYLQRAFGHPSRSRLTRYSDLRAYLIALEGLERGSDPAVAAVPLRRSELLAQGDALLTQLGWSAEQGRAFLERELNRISRQQLSDVQLLQFNMLLEGELLTREAPAAQAAPEGSQR